MDHQLLSDKIEIAELLARYARAVDTKDWDLFRTVFMPDASIDYTSAGGKAGTRDEMTEWLSTTLVIFSMTQHLITNIEADVDGDRAKVRAMFYNPLRFDGQDQVIDCGGLYLHDLVRTPDGWKSERLLEKSEWFRNVPQPK